MSLSWIWAKRSFAAGVLVAGLVVGGCVSKACPDGEKLQSGKCVPKNAAAAHRGADSGKPESDGGLQDAAASTTRDAEVAADADITDAHMPAEDAGTACSNAQPLQCWQDKDSDGYAASDAASMSLACEAKCPTGWVARKPAGDDVDCDDDDAKRRPRACWRDEDMDGFSADAHGQRVFCGKTCGAGWTATEPTEGHIDCSDRSDSSNPKATEICNGVDNDCDGKVDEDAVCLADNASGVCADGNCKLGKCNSGFADCDDYPYNGCEQALDVVDDCGACGSVCDPYASCGATKVKGVGQCACDAPSFGDGATCHGPGPVAAGPRWTCMIDEELHASCIGTSGTIKNTSKTTQYRQIAIGNTLGMGCGVTMSGELDCWTGGIVPTDGKYIQVVVGDTFVCGLTEEHDTLCWAYGAGASSGEASPPEQKFTQLAAGFFHACGLRPDGKVTCWGAGSTSRGSMNCATENPARYDCGQAQPPSDEFVQITAGRLHTCGLKADGSVKCWGIGATSATTPAAWDYGQAKPPGSAALSSIAAGQWHTCGIRKDDGTAVCWGAGQNGASDTYDHGQSAPSDDSFLVLSSGWFHSCGLTTQNKLVCWGDNTDNKASPDPSARYPLNPGR